MLRPDAVREGQAREQGVHHGARQGNPLDHAAVLKLGNFEPAVGNVDERRGLGDGLGVGLGPRPALVCDIPQGDDAVGCRGGDAVGLCRCWREGLPSGVAGRRDVGAGLLGPGFCGGSAELADMSKNDIVRVHCWLSVGSGGVRRGEGGVEWDAENG